MQPPRDCGWIPGRSTGVVRRLVREIRYQGMVVRVQRQGEALPAESPCPPLQQVQLASLRALVPERLARQAAHSVLRSLVPA